MFYWGYSKSKEDVERDDNVVPRLLNQNVSRMCNGSKHTLLLLGVLVDDGTVIAAGSNEHGQSGLESSYVYLAVPGHNLKYIFNEPLRATDIAVHGFTSVLLSSGHVYVCGWYNDMCNHTPIRLCRSAKSIFAAVAKEILQKASYAPVVPCIAPPAAKASVESTSLNPFANALNEEDSSDITFIVKEKKIYAHSCILKIRSDYFKIMLKSRCKETETGEIQVEDTSYDALFAYLQNIYG